MFIHEVFARVFKTLERWVDQQVFLENEEPQEYYPEEALAYIKEKTHIKLEWPAYQKFMEEDWWPEDCHFSDNNGRSVVLIPTDQLLEYKMEKIE